MSPLRKVRLFAFLALKKISAKYFWRATVTRARSRPWHSGCGSKSTNFLGPDSCSYRNELTILVACAVYTCLMTKVARWLNLAPPESLRLLHCPPMQSGSLSWVQATKMRLDVKVCPQLCWVSNSSFLWVLQLLNALIIPETAVCQVWEGERHRLPPNRVMGELESSNSSHTCIAHPQQILTTLYSGMRSESAPVRVSTVL